MILITLQVPVLEDLLKRNDADDFVVQWVLAKALANKNDTDPPTVVDWSLQRLLAILNNPVVQTLAPPLPPTLVLPPRPITEGALKTAILFAIRGATVPPLIPGGAFGFESSAADIGNIAAAATSQCGDPWWVFQDAQSVAFGNGTICPIAQLWIPRPRTNTLTRTAMLFPVPPTMVPLFN